MGSISGVVGGVRRVALGSAVGAAVVMGAAGAAAWQARVLGGVPAPGVSPETRTLQAEVSTLQARVATLEADSQKLQAGSQKIDALGERVAAHEETLGTLVEADAWGEAASLGIARAVAARHTGLSPRDEVRLSAAIVREAHAQGLDPRLVAAVVEVESGFDLFAVSPVGALGLMQLMPATADALSPDAAEGSARLFDLERNVQLGCRYLAKLVHDFGDERRALVAYNMGPTAARKALAGPRARALLAGYPRAVERARERMSRGAPQAALARFDAERAR